jgi:sugar O-acyltransferase (sialic acid O-acetyltransferase NeuD family)
MNAMLNAARVAVIGGGGHAREVIATLEAAGYRAAAIFDDDPRRHGERVLGVEVQGTTQSLVTDFERRFDYAILAIGDNQVRCRLARALSLRWISLIHPVAWVHPSAQLGEGTVVFAGAIVQPDCVIGAHVIINTAASLSHDCVLENYVHTAPGARLTGGVQIQEGAFIGAGSTLLPGLEVGAWTTVGAGSTVTRSLPANAIALGSPARVRRSQDFSS